MRVLHLSTLDTDAAAKGMMRWHKCLKEAGVDSRVLCLQKSLDDPDIFEPSLLADRTESLQSRATQEHWIDKCRTSFSDSRFSQAFYAQPLIGEELTDWAEIVHIHSAFRSFDLSHFADLATKGKVLVLSPHDLWPITGGCHSTAGCEKYREGCHACPMVKPESQRLVEISRSFKQKVFSVSIQALICPSTQIRDEVIRCPGFESVDTYVIPGFLELERGQPEQTLFDGKETVQHLQSAYATAVAKSGSKAIPLSVSDERGEYRSLALRAIVDLLESAQKQATELAVEVQWLREQSLALAGLREILERSLAEIDENALKGPAELEYEVRWHRNQSLEIGQIREIFRICVAEIDEMFSFAPGAVRDRYSPSTKETTRVGTTGDQRSLEQQWRETSSKLHLLKEFLGRRRKKLDRLKEVLGWRPKKQ